MQVGGPFTYEDLVRWPSGAEKVEIYGGGLLYSGRFNEDDAAAAQRTYPDHEIHLDEQGLWILPAGSGSLVEHLARISRRGESPTGGL